VIHFNVSYLYVRSISILLKIKQIQIYIARQNAKSYTIADQFLLDSLSKTCAVEEEERSISTIIRAYRAYLKRIRDVSTRDLRENRVKQI